MDKSDILKHHMGKHYKGYLIATAMLEDYAKVVSRIEGIEESAVKERIERRVKEIAQDEVKNMPKADDE